MSVLPKSNIYAEITAAQLLRPRIDLLTKDGGLDYKELNKRIVAENRTENIPVDHNPVYGGISKEVCGVERQESFTISDKLLSFDKLGYTISPRKVVVKTDDTFVTASGFYGDPLTIDINALVATLSLNAKKVSGESVDGSLSIDDVKLIIDESIKNPLNIDFSDRDHIALTINPFADNVVPLIFTPSDEALSPSFTSVKILVVDSRTKAVIPEVSAGAHLEVSELNDTNATSFKNNKGELTTDDCATFEGKLLNSETKEELTSITCEVKIGTKFPANPTAYQMQGIDVATKASNTLFAEVTLKQASMRDLKIVLPIIYASDDRPEATSITNFSLTQSEPLELTYDNAGYTFRGDAAVIDSATVSSNVTATATGATLTLSDAVIEKSLNLNQASSKAHVVVSFEDDLANPMTFDIEIKDSRPFKEKEKWSVSASTLATEIDDTVFNAGSKGQEWNGDALVVTGSISKIANQFGREITDFVLVSGKQIDLSENSLEVANYHLHILADEGASGSVSADSVAYILLSDMTQIEVTVTVTVTDNRS